MCQFHQHFTGTFFVRKCFAQLFSSYVLAKVWKHFHTKNPHVECWWNSPWEARGRKNLVLKKSKLVLNSLTMHNFNLDNNTIVLIIQFILYYLFVISYRIASKSLAFFDLNSSIFLYWILIIENIHFFSTKSVLHFYIRFDKCTEILKCIFKSILEKVFLENIVYCAKKQTNFSWLVYKTLSRPLSNFFFAFYNSTYLWKYQVSMITAKLHRNKVVNWCLRLSEYWK